MTTTSRTDYPNADLESVRRHHRCCLSCELDVEFHPNEHCAHTDETNPFCEPCDYCGQRFAPEPALQKLQLMTHCGICCISFDSWAQVILHMAKEHILTCGTCDYQGFEHEVLTHFKEAHRREEVTI